MHINAADYTMAQLVKMYKEIDPSFSLDRFRTKEAGAAKINGYFYNSQFDPESDNYGPDDAEPVAVEPEPEETPLRRISLFSKPVSKPDRTPKTDTRPVITQTIKLNFGG